VTSPLQPLRIVRQEASFRDPAGFLYRSGGVLLRQVHSLYSDNYEIFLSSGLYDELVASDLIVDHEERPLSEAADSRAWKVLLPREIHVISYPYEWSFSQLKDAALLTLDIAQRSLAYGLVLKDATAYNVTFDAGRPIWLDSLSFEKYTEGEAWQAYSQFSRHFLAPLALASHVDPRLMDLLRVYIEGVPLDLASALLPRRTWARPSHLLHLHLHARSQQRYASLDPSGSIRSRSFSRRSFEGLLAGLRETVEKLRWEPEGYWPEYECDNSYSDEGHRTKVATVERWLSKLGPGQVLDLGANTGLFSGIAAGLGHSVVALDGDAGATEAHYRRCRADKSQSVLPLRIDLLNPSPDQGWACLERMNLYERVRPDVAMALALVHHLALTGHIALGDQAAFLARVAPTVIVEWIPLSDPQAKRLVGDRTPQFVDHYSRESFERVFGHTFTIADSVGIPDSERRLFLLERHEGRGRLESV
jgi:hypothetical protein